MRLAFLPVLVSTLVTVAALAQPTRGGTPHFWPEGADPRPGADLRAPTELAGFRMDWAPTRARTACRRAGHGWDEAFPLARCEGAVREPGFPVRVRLRFCTEKLCEIIAEHTSERGWGGAYVAALSALRAAFGREQSSRFRGVDEGCVATLEAGGDGECFRRDGQARHYWAAGGSELELRLERGLGEPAPTLRVIFRGVARVREIDLASN